MGNFIFATVLLSIIIIFTAVNSVIICSICDEIIAYIDSGNIKRACEVWSEKKNYIAIFVRDAEIDVVNAEAEAAGEEIEVEDGEAATKGIKLRDAINEIKNSEKPNFQDIF